jgi:hypothetical protein
MEFSTITISQLADLIIVACFFIAVYVSVLYLLVEAISAVMDFIRDKRIAPFYRARLYETMIDLAFRPEMEHVDSSEFLLEAEFSGFSKAYRQKMLRMLIEILSNTGSHSKPEI